MSVLERCPSHGGVRLKGHHSILFLKVWLRCVFFFSQLNNMADAKVTLFGLQNFGGEKKVTILNELNTMSYPRAIDSHHLFQQSCTINHFSGLTLHGKVISRLCTDKCRFYE